ncbi:MAG: phosphohistidine phosphatase SixA [Verrucomicrobiae bacterium]|nr:phosphohistidine phosphatase SixA [Verrucomicrobiae bacterium]
MRLLFLRHADALESADDFNRPLSPKGKKQAKIIGQFLRRSGNIPDAVCSSPLLRTMQTAEIVLSHCETEKKVAVAATPALANGTSQPHFNEWIKEIRHAKCALLVGHMPSLAERIAHLLGMSSPESLKLPKTGLYGVETEDCRSGILQFFLSPKLLEPLQ